MKYISDDGKVFNTEHECLEHEKCLEEEKRRKEKLEMERKNRLDSINKKYEDLQKDVSEYKKDYGNTGIGYISPFEEFAKLILVC